MDKTNPNMNSNNQNTNTNPNTNINPNTNPNTYQQYPPINNPLYNQQHYIPQQASQIRPQTFPALAPTTFQPWPQQGHQSLNTPSTLPQAQPPASIPQGTPQAPTAGGAGLVAHSQQVRPVPPPSDPLAVLPAGAPILPGATTIGTGWLSGRNMLALWGSDRTPRTRSTILVERGRGGRMADQSYPPVSMPIPARTSLEEICQRFPNHVWGSLLRIFLAEGWTGQEVWRKLPPAVRHSNSQTRPWNYIQQAMGRELDEMFREHTGQRRVAVPRKNPLPVVAPAPAAIMPTSRDLTLEDLETIAADAYNEGVALLRDIVEIRHGISDITILDQTARRMYAGTRDGWIANIAANYQAATGQFIDGSDPIEMLRQVVVQLGSLQQRPNEGVDAFRGRGTREAWRQYVGAIQGWVENWREELGELETQEAEGQNGAAEEEADEEEEEEEVDDAEEDGEEDQQHVAAGYSWA